MIETDVLNQRAFQFRQGQFIECDIQQPVHYSLLLGYSIYTTFRFPLSEPLFSLHWKRLSKDASTMGLQFEHSEETLFNALNDCYQSLNAPNDIVFRLTLVPNVTELNVLLKKTEPLESDLMLSLRYVSHKHSPTPTLKLKTVEHHRPLPTVKHGSMADTLLLKRQAIQDGFDDILLSRNDYITEAATSNCFFIQGDALITAHPENDGCLDGITRQQIISLANTLNIPVSEKTLPLSSLSECDGAFLTNAVSGIMPVQSINKYTLPWPNTAYSLIRTLSE